MQSVGRMIELCTFFHLCFDQETQIWPKRGLLSFVRVQSSEEEDCSAERWGTCVLLSFEGLGTKCCFMAGCRTTAEHMSWKEGGCVLLFG